LPSYERKIADVEPLSSYIPRKKVFVPEQKTDSRIASNPYPVLLDSAGKNQLYFSSLNNTSSKLQEPLGTQAYGKPLVIKAANYSAATPFKNSYIGHGISHQKSNQASIETSPIKQYIF
jgi:hypothetical protein